jgi:hypothetical protein
MSTLSSPHPSAMRHTHTHTHNSSPPTPPPASPLQTSGGVGSTAATDSRPPGLSQRHSDRALPSDTPEAPPRAPHTHSQTAGAGRWILSRGGSGGSSGGGGGAPSLGPASFRVPGSPVRSGLSPSSARSASPTPARRPQQWEAGGGGGPVPPAGVPRPRPFSAALFSHRPGSPVAAAGGAPTASAAATAAAPVAAAPSGTGAAAMAPAEARRRLAMYLDNVAPTVLVAPQPQPTAPAPNAPRGAASPRSASPRSVPRSASWSRGARAATSASPRGGREAASGAPTRRQLAFGEGLVPRGVAPAAAAGSVGGGVSLGARMDRGSRSASPTLSVRGDAWQVRAVSMGLATPPPSPARRHAWVGVLSTGHPRGRASCPLTPPRYPHPDPGFPHWACDRGVRPQQSAQAAPPPQWWAGTTLTQMQTRRRCLRRCSSSSSGSRPAWALPLGPTASSTGC